MIPSHQTQDILKTDPLFYLNQDITTRVLNQFLGTQDVLNAGLVNKKWREYFTDSNIWTNKLKEIANVYFNDTLNNDNPFKGYLRQLSIKRRIVNKSPLIKNIPILDPTFCYSLGVHNGEFIGHFENSIAKITATVELPGQLYDYDKQGLFLGVSSGSIKKENFEIIENRCHQHFSEMYGMHWNYLSNPRDVIRLDDVYFVNMQDSIFTMNLDGSKRATIKNSDLFPGEPKQYVFKAVTLFKDQFVVGYLNGGIKFYDKDLKLIAFFPSETVVALTVCGNKLISAHTDHLGLNCGIRVWNDDMTYTKHLVNGSRISRLDPMGDYLIVSTEDRIKIFDLDGQTYFLPSDYQFVNNLAINGAQILFECGRSLCLIDFLRDQKDVNSIHESLDLSSQSDIINDKRRLSLKTRITERLRRLKSLIMKIRDLKPQGYQHLHKQLQKTSLSYDY
ncbi:MAG: hypothetical protein JHC93_08495 [Parachlamydiales bacterium]|nr:hypothetical protein [Parachlamydiales bacterium]